MTLPQTGSLSVTHQGCNKPSVKCEAPAAKNTILPSDGTIFP